MGVKFHRLWLRYHRALFVGAVCVAAFFLGRMTATFKWSDAILIALWFGNACVFFIPLWRQEKRDRQELRSLMRSMEAELEQHRREDS